MPKWFQNISNIGFVISLIGLIVSIPFNIASFFMTQKFSILIALMIFIGIASFLILLSIRNFKIYKTFIPLYFPQKEEDFGIDVKLIQEIMESEKNA